MTAIAIRPLAPDDLEAWLPLWRGYLAFYGANLSEEQTGLTWSRIHDVASPMHALCAFDGEALVGFSVYLFHLSSWSPGSYCYLEDLFTAEAARGRGAAGALIEATAADARSRGATKLYWQTNAKNERARALYDRVAENEGFIVYSRALT
jgi:GNAT superfamily N-acetyltransferase